MGSKHLKHFLLKWENRLTGSECELLTLQLNALEGGMVAIENCSAPVVAGGDLKDYHFQVLFKERLRLYIVIQIAACRPPAKRWRLENEPTSSKGLVIRVGERCTDGGQCFLFQN